MGDESGMSKQPSNHVHPILFLLIVSCLWFNVARGCEINTLRDRVKKLEKVQAAPRQIKEKQL
jgi:hypothetical protein